MTDRVVVDITVAAPPDAVWRALREPEEIKRWFGWDYDGLDEEVKVIFLEGDDAASMDDDRRVVSWPNGDRFTLTEASGRTVLRVTRAPVGPDTDWERYYDDIDEGWLTFAHQLRFALERQPGRDRRTVFLSGGATSDSFYPLTGALGLGHTTTLRAGDRYSASTPMGELTGEVWYVSRYQIGLTIDELDGLFAVELRPPHVHTPHGGAMAVLTTYGQDDEAYAVTRRRWAEAFKASHRPGEDAAQWGAA